MIAATMRLALAVERPVQATTRNRDGTMLRAPQRAPILWDDRHLAFGIESDSATAGNLGRHPAIVLDVIDPRGGGWRFEGCAAVLSTGELHRRVLARLPPPGAAVVLMQVDRARKLAAPGHDTGAAAGRAA